MGDRAAAPPGPRQARAQGNKIINPAYWSALVILRWACIGYRAIKANASIGKRTSSYIYCSNSSLYMVFFIICLLYFYIFSIKKFNIYL